jgi:hypothetical protein
VQRVAELVGSERKKRLALPDLLEGLKVELT